MAIAPAGSIAKPSNNAIRPRIDRKDNARGQKLNCDSP
jgi:hypothetical protein